jgi:hypothetical protein
MVSHSPPVDLDQGGELGTVVALVVALAEAPVQPIKATGQCTDQYDF